METLEAYESYQNGNISQFRGWLKKASKKQIVHVTYLWLENGEPLIKLKSYCEV